MTVTRQLQMTAAVCVLLLLMSSVIFFHTCPGEQSDVSKPQVQKSVPTYAPPPPEQCRCPTGALILAEHLPANEVQELVKRRERELKHYKARTETVFSKLLFSVPNSPLKYPIQGFTVKPRIPTVIPGLELQAGHRSNYKVILSVTKGSLTPVTPPGGVMTDGEEESKLTIESYSLLMLNYVLGRVKYTSKLYEINSGDIATLKFEEYEAQFPIVIKQPQFPILYDMGKDINSQVTIITKTFQSYDSLGVLIKSIRQFYKKIPIIIADDSFEPQKVTGENIRHYIMPPGQGWFAGRNLAVSQVTTKYFLWVDDDFLFTKDTKIELLLRVLEGNPKLDVAGGSVDGHQFYFSLYYDEGQEMDGGCLSKVSFSRYQHFPGWPGCSLTSGVVNFFLARTDAVQKVGFDPRLQKVSHTEFFMGAFGSLMVVTCSRVNVLQQQSTKKTKPDLYQRYRGPGKGDEMMKNKLYFFKNNLKCVHYG